MNNITLKKARILADLTQKEMAKKLGVSAPTYAKLERSPELVTVGQAKKISEIVGISYDSLFFCQKL